jgi:hypothetical protein
MQLSNSPFMFLITSQLNPEVLLFSGGQQTIQATGELSMSDVTGPGRELHGRFLAFGDMTGKTAGEITTGVGSPSSISSMVKGQKLMQWQATGCHIAVLFDADERFIKITHQFAQYQPAPSGVPGAIGIIFGILICIAILISVLH